LLNNREQIQLGERMMQSRLVWALVCFGFLLSGCGRISSATIERAAARAAERRSASVMARDLARDNASRITRLPAERRVYRYATESQARAFEGKGFPPRTHFTASEGPGRPLSGAAAQERYGLPYSPDRRLSVTLPEGTALKSNKVVGGAPGYGEIRIERGLPPDRITSESVLPPGRK
jgi:hypothetical protein